MNLITPETTSLSEVIAVFEGIVSHIQEGSGLKEDALFFWAFRLLKQMNLK